MITVSPNYINPQIFTIITIARLTLTTCHTPLRAFHVSYVPSSYHWLWQYTFELPRVVILNHQVVIFRIRLSSSLALIWHLHTFPVYFVSSCSYFRGPFNATSYLLNVPRTVCDQSKTELHALLQGWPHCVVSDASLMTHTIVTPVLHCRSLNYAHVFTCWAVMNTVVCTLVSYIPSIWWLAWLQVCSANYSSYVL